MTAERIIDSVGVKAAMAVSVSQMEALTRQLQAARYAFHKVTVHKYALAVVRGEMTAMVARQHYDQAMANFDGIVAAAVVGAQDLNMAETAKGSSAIDEALKAAGHG